MPLVLKDRVKETSTTTGTGTLTLGGAATGFQSFAVIGNGNTTYYAIFDRTSQDWEVGVGTYTASGTTLSRDTVLESSNSGSLVNFGAGTKDVFCTYPAEKAVTLDDVQTLTNKTISGANNTLSNIANASLTNSSITFGSTAQALGSTVSALNGVSIGATTASTGAFTNLSYTGTLTGGTGVINIGSGQLYKDASGNVGIGTSSPNAKTTIVQGTESYGLSIQASSISEFGNIRFTNSGFTAEQALISSISGGGLLFNTGSGSTERMRIDSAGNVGIGTSSPSSLGKLVVVGGNIVANGGGTGDPEFRLNGASGGVTRNYAMGTDATQRLYWYDYTASAYRMVIDSTGNVGIGTSSPDAKLHISATDINQLLLQRTGAITGSYRIAVAGANNNLYIQDTAQSADRLVINSNGNVGIGTSSPAQALSVSGNIAATGSIDCGTQFLGLAADSAAAPSFSFTGDTDTGMFRSGTNQVSLTTGGTDRMRITSAGKILASAGTNWVGTVSQNGLSSIIEQGSNANGRFVKYADGTQICFVRNSTTPVANTLTSSSHSWPANFSADPRLSCACDSTVYGTTVTAMTARSASTTGYTQTVLRSNTTTTILDVVAVGRWY
jgi:hypothetical protein